MKVYKKFSPQGKEKNKKMQMHGNYRLIKKDGRIGWNALEKQAVIELLDHNVNEPEGAISVWFMSLEELCTTLRYDNFRMHNQFYDNYAIISDQREVCDHDNATFCINWNCGWYPQLSGKFFKGAIYPTGYAPVPKAIVTAGHCSFDKEEWYQLVFTWNKPENRYQIYINGILVAHSDTYTNGMEWEQAGERLYLGNPTFCISDIAFYQDELQSEEIKKLFKDECCQVKDYVQKELESVFADKEKVPFQWEPDEDWETALELSLDKEEQREQFYVQGAVDSVYVTEEGFLIDTPNHVPKHDNFGQDLDQMYLWTKQSFEGDLYVEFDFKSIRPGGLALLMFQASGMQREDFMKEYPLRTNGSMSKVHSEDVRNYHWEFFREMNDTRNDVCSQVVLKNPWFRPLGFHCMETPLTRDEWHTLKLLQRGASIQCVIDDIIVLDLKDDGFGNNGPILSAGHLAIRCMVRTKMLFRNLKVMNRRNFEVIEEA